MLSGTGWLAIAVVVVALLAILTGWWVVRRRDGRGLRPG